MKKLFIIFTILSTLGSAGFASQTMAEEFSESFLLPEIYIKAINPGYTVDGEANVGEFIELGRSPSSSISLAGFVLSYTNSSGNSVILYEFPEGSWMTGESILLRLASSSGSELANLTYDKTLAFKAGPLMLTSGETIIDSICWNNKSGCAKEFKSSNPTTLVRNVETGGLLHQEFYEPAFCTKSFQIIEPEPEPGCASESEPEPVVEAVVESEPEPELEPEDELESEPEPVKTPHCQGLEFSEIYTYYESDQSEQFIEFYNSTKEPIVLDGCEIKYKSKFHPLVGTVAPESYFVRELSDFSLTKNPIRSNLIEVIDEDGSVATSLTYPNGQKKATSYAKFEDEFKTTYSITPGKANVYQQYRSCEEGKVINEKTGNCVKDTTANAAAATTKTCPEGKYLNPLTGRCKNIQNNTGAEYPTALSQSDNETKNASFTALYAVLAIIALALGLIIFEFRFEIKKLCGKVCRRVLQRPRHGFDRR